MAASSGVRDYPISVSPTRSGPPGSVHNPLFLRSSSPDVPLASTSQKAMSARSSGRVATTSSAVARDKRYIDIIRGPPSTISQTIPRVTRDPPSAISQTIPRRRTRKVTALLKATLDRPDSSHVVRPASPAKSKRANCAPCGHAPCLRSSSPPRPPLALDPRRRPPDPGFCQERDEPLTDISLLRSDVHPPNMTTTRAHQACGICLHIKSHPVSYRCGHSHCYRCIRVWLEKKWTCPTCRAVMHVEPYRHYGEEDGILLDHPTFVDRSVVDYSWDGLRFPKAPKVRVPIELDL
ncbi:hypothetical protein DFH06DRAFT_1348994 [Mycena polygramma]|nr:hypothetical protein DFH06DRAFT_1348994 [Mycena polygramma]